MKLAFLLFIVSFSAILCPTESSDPDDEDESCPNGCQHKEGTKWRELGSDYKQKVEKIDSAEDCCEKCTETTDCGNSKEPCIAWSWKGDNYKECYLFSKLKNEEDDDQCEQKEKYTSGWRYLGEDAQNAENGRKCSCRPLGDVAGDPHFTTLDGKRVNAIHQPLHASDNLTQIARYLLLRTVACHGDGKEKGFPPMNMEYDLMTRFKDRPGVKTLYVDLFFNRQKKRGKYIRVEMTVLPGLGVDVKAYEDGKISTEYYAKGLRGETAICSVRGSDCNSADEPRVKINSMRSGSAFIFVEELALKVRLIEKKDHIELSFSDDFAQNLRGNMMGMMGNFDGNSENDEFCPLTGEDGEIQEIHDRCWEVTNSNHLSLAHLNMGIDKNTTKTTTKFFPCLSGQPII